MSCVLVLQRGHSGDGYDLRKGDLFVLSWARVRRVRRGSISSEVLMCGGGVCSIMLGDFNAQHPSWYSRSTDTRGRRMDDSIYGLTMVSSTGTAPRESAKRRVEFASCLISINFPHHRLLLADPVNA